MEPNIAYLGALVGDVARSKMLTALMSGKALTATELSLEANITPQTASSHLMKLVDSELITVRKQGRHKYFQLKDIQVAELIEKMLNMSASMAHTSIATGPTDERLKRSRICYDHLAGELGVQLFDTLQSNGWIVEAQDTLTLTQLGLGFFSELGFDIATTKKSRRPLCKACLDWSERRSHLAGYLGKWVLSDVLERKWAHQHLDSRAIEFTSHGLKAFKSKYHL
ncbi:helix-turn-helix transcriptional regulator [Pseudoalteromonas sp. JBTF-M23]|uniref:Helix-turn-helix transcriptional regulator n=1 Tax=Pseudoalteromonas caenipelagi TaxID=2726988 RepID=A0A849VKQ0_9GAMM|nr:helix-turn-helix domain-containing protein [Pseudoalteromonas caenipelagi]NOU52281.1 helix-turn-helix transcriptional regulator [Pseudoalteromonas caenipelagi]